LSLVNLLFLASLEERSIHGELDYFLGAGDKDDFKEKILADKTTKNGLALFWEATARPEMEAFSYFQE